MTRIFLLMQPTLSPSLLVVVCIMAHIVSHLNEMALLSGGEKINAAKQRSLMD